MNTNDTGTQLLSTQSLTDTPIVNPSGEDLGKLDELMLDVGTGEVAYAVVSFGGFFGLGDKQYAVPWEALKIDTDEHRIVMDVDRERIEQTPGLDADSWPSAADTKWMTELYRQYGMTYEPRGARRIGSV